MTLELEGLQQDGTFAPGSNATWIREGKDPRGCPIGRNNLREGWIEFSCNGDLIRFSCDSTGNNCSAKYHDG